MFASIRIKEMLARVSPSFDSNFASRLRRLVGVFTHRRFVSFSFTQSERSPLPTQKLKKKITQGVSFVAASVIALNAAPALAVSPIEIQDRERKRWWSPAHLRGAPFVLRAIQNRGGVRDVSASFFHFTKARSALFFVGRRRRKGMISRIKKSFFLIRRLFASKKKREL